MPRLGAWEIYPRRLDARGYNERFGRLFREERCIYLLFSPGLGLGLRWLSEHSLPASSRLLIFETDSALLPFFRGEALPADVSPTGEEEYGIEQLLKDWQVIRSGITRQKQIDLCPHGPGSDQLRWLHSRLADLQGQRRVRGLRFTRLRPEAEKSALQLEALAVSLVRQHWRNHSTSLYMSSLWIRNAWTNMLRHGWQHAPAELDALLPPGDVLLAGAGTSLEDGLAALDPDSRPAIVAVDTALPALLSRGLIPAAVLMLEAQFANMDDFICSSLGIDPRYRDMLLIHDLCAHPPSVRLFNRRMVFVSRFSENSMLRRFEAFAEAIPPLGSVGIAALYLLLRYTKRRIVFCGFDFAFPNGRTHAGGTPFHLRMLRRANRLNPAAAWGFPLPRYRSISPGILSDDILLSYAESFSEVLTLFGSDRVRVLAHRGPEFSGLGNPVPPGLQTAEEAVSALPATSAQTGERTLSIVWKKELADLENDLGELRAKLSQLLMRVSPDAELQEQDTLVWEGILSSLRRHDFLWRFLPGEPEPAFSRAFLVPLGASINYWLRVLSRMSN